MLRLKAMHLSMALYYGTFFMNNNISKKKNYQKIYRNKFLKIYQIFMLTSMLVLLTSCSRNGGPDATTVGDNISTQDNLTVMKEEKESVNEEKSTGEKSTSEKSTSEKSSGEKSTGEKSISEKSTSEKSISDNNPVDEWIETHTLEEKIAQLFIIRPELLDSDKPSITVSSSIKNNYKKYPVSGFILFSQNIENREQTSQLLKNLKLLAKTNSEVMPFLAVDEEGGRVVRVADRISGCNNVGYMSQFGLTNDADAAFNAGYYTGCYLKDLGFNTDFAPVFDVLSNPDAIVKDRVISSDPLVVSNLAPSFSKGLNSAGILSCAKHFPGHGNTALDTHTDFAQVNSTYEELKACDLLPYYNAVNGEVSMIMVAHVTYPNVTGDYTPASLSHAIVTDILRKDMGYNGVIITDSLSMGAIANNYNAAIAAEMAVNSGVDLLLTDDKFVEMYNGILSAVKSGRISEERINESLRRILILKQKL